MTRMRVSWRRTTSLGHRTRARPPPLHPSQRTAARPIAPPVPDQASARLLGAGCRCLTRAPRAQVCSQRVAGINAAQAASCCGVRIHTSVLLLLRNTVQQFFRDICVV